jgi:hypothetical protein
MKKIMAMVAACWLVAVAMAGVDPVNTTLFGVAIKGYDPVAYFTAGKPVEGAKEFEYLWQDAKWRFASEVNRDTFKAAPEKFAPQYGGYCAWAVSQGYTANIDPSAWKIVDGKLYLNYSAEVQKKWSVDIPGFIKSADANWPKLKE